MAAHDAGVMVIRARIDDPVPGAETVVRLAAREPRSGADTDELAA